MNVRELIVKLIELPLDFEVVYFHFSDDAGRNVYEYIENVELDGTRERVELSDH